MGFALEFGPVPASIPEGPIEHPDDWEAWKGPARLGADAMERLAQLAASSGFTVARADAQRVVLEGAFESFQWDPSGGWLSKPATDEATYAAQYAFLQRLCDEANWAIYEPSGASLLYVPGREVAPQPEFYDPDLPSEAEVQRALAVVASREGDVLEAVTLLGTSSADWPEALGALAVCLQPGYPVAVRRQAALALEGARARGLPARAALIDALADADADVRASAAAALGFLGPDAERALPKLEALLEDPDSSVRSVAEVSIAKIGARRSSKPTPGAEVEATVIFRGANMVVAKTAGGKNVNLKWPEAPLRKGETLALRIDDEGTCREVRWTDAEGTQRSRGFADA